MERGGGALARLARDTGSLGDKGALAPRPVTGTRRRSSGTCGFASPGGGGGKQGETPRQSRDLPPRPAPTAESGPHLRHPSLPPCVVPTNVRSHHNIKHSNFYLKKTTNGARGQGTTQTKKYNTATESVNFTCTSVTYQSK